MSDPGRTRRLPDVSAAAPNTRRLPAIQGGPPSIPGGANRPGWIPEELAAQFDDITELSRKGGDADIFLVTSEGQEQVLKLYRSAVPDPQVWKALREPASAHLPWLLRHDVTAGHAWELWDHYPLGDLAAHLQRDRPEGLSAAEVEQVVAQLIEALEELHAQGIPHRDLKPGNILLRGIDPLDVVLIDFSAAVHLGPHTVVYRTVSCTVAYSAPEVFAKENSVAADLWSLGITVVELATGKPVFDPDVDTQVIISQILKHVIPIPDGLPPRLRLLCEGLIVGDSSTRWGTSHVRRWLAGEEPDVPRSRAPVSADRAPLEFNGESFTERSLLAGAVAMNWGLATARFFGPSAEPLADLLAWAGQFDDVGQPGSAAELAERIGDPARNAHTRLLLLTRWLDPGMPPFYLDRRLTRADLPVVAHQASGQGASALHGQRIVQDLWEGGLLRELDDAPECAGLADVDRAWRAAAARWDVLIERLAAAHPEILPTLERWQGPRLYAYLLWLAADPEAAAELRGEVARAHRRIAKALRPTRSRLDWFDEVVAKAIDPAGLLTAFAAAGYAEAVAQRIQRDNAGQEARRRAWERVERWRDLDRPVAIAWGGASTGIVLIAWALILLLGDAVGTADPAAMSRAWIIMAVTATLQVGAELWLAAVIGGPYHPYYSLMLGIGHFAERVGGRLRNTYVLGPVAIGATTAVLLGLVLYVPLALPLILLPLHLGWIRVRYGRWRADYRQRRSAALGPRVLEASPVPEEGTPA